MLTNKGKYRLKAMVHLAGAPPGRLVLSSEIAERNGIPRKFLDAIMADLRQAGLLRSRKGYGGGYTLARSPRDITLGAIVRALDGPLAPIGCASRTAYHPCDDCPDVARCAVRLIMLEVRDAVAAVLDRRTLAEMRAMTTSEREAVLYQI